MLPLAPNDSPPDSIVIAAEIRVDQKSSNGMLAQRVKKILRTRPCSECSPASRAAFIKGTQNLVLLLRRQAGKFSNAGKHLDHSRMQFRQALAVGFLVLGSKSHQAAVDKINDTGFPRSRSFVRRNNPRRDSLYLNRLLRREKLKFCRRHRLRGLMCVRCG